MNNEMSEIEAFCNECKEETRMRFVKREGEYLVYECSVCDSTHEFSEQDIEKNVEEEMV